MPGQQLRTVVSFLRRIACAGASEVADEQLLRRFSAQQDSTAFAALVQRHGGMVLSVCQRVLNNSHDAEDAFQATFLVLARKAAAVGKPAQLANWLYGVAYRTALEAKTRRTKRLLKERHAVGTQTTEPSLDVVWTEVREVLDEEINHLPNQYRAPFVLCCLEGKTNEEAATILGIPLGTIFSRLAWARQRLRLRLTRRGLTLTASVLATILVDKVAKAAVPGALAANTVESALVMASGSVAATVVSAEVCTLTQTVLSAMRWAQLKWAAAAVFAIVAVMAVGTGGILALTSTAAPEQELASAPAPNQLHVQAKPDVAPVPAPLKPDIEGLQGEWKAVKLDHAGAVVNFDDNHGLLYAFNKDRLTITPVFKVDRADMANMFKGAAGLGKVELGEALAMLAEWSGRKGPVDANKDFPPGKSGILGFPGFNGYALLGKGALGHEVVVRLNESTNPKSIEQFVSVKGSEFVVFRGEYQLSGDVLTIWAAGPRQDRAAVAGDNDSARTLIEFVRQ